MGLIDTLRDWLAGLFSGAGSDEADESTDTTTGAVEAADEGGGSNTTGANDGSDTAGANDGSDTTGSNDGLDPGAVTETRSEATDDAVEALQNVRESGPGDTAGDDGEGTSPPGGLTESSTDTDTDESDTNS